MLEIFDAAFAANPWPVLDRLRRQGGVHRVRTPDGPPAWLITRYADVRAGLLDPRLSTDTRLAGPRDYRGFTVPPPLDALLVCAPADHARMRAVVTTELSPRRLTDLTRRIPDLIETLAKNLESEDTADLVQRLAVPLPAAVLGELLGLRGPEREALLDWAESTLPATATHTRARDTLATMSEVVLAIQDSAARDSDTVIAGLVAARRAAELTADELTGLLFYLLFVWYEVLTDLVAGSILTLLTRPDQIRVLRRGANKLPMVDELLRYISPQVLAGPRFATEDMTIGRYDIGCGDTVLLCLAAANRDPDQVDGPGKLDLTRTRNRQLGLGHGVHACLGAALVRTVTASTLDHVFTRWPATTLTVSERDIRWRSGFRHRGPLTLPVHLD
ncbi:cytochrome P450 [Nocardia arizonensis]|uniref:cytochrome P450 n=1 Tax=Nocardia arizonensis TaxID=1141647 RepID=UPI0007A7491E|nr:cytochrome P450 [Nocardia arizonensis]